MTTATIEKIKVGDTVATKSAGDVLGIVKRFKKGKAYVQEGEAEPTVHKMEELVKVTKLRPAKASAPSDKGDTPARPARPSSDVTNKIQIKVTGVVRGAVWKPIARSFEDVAKAQEYLKEFDLVDVNDREAKVKAPAEADVYTNYAIDLIMAGTPPKGPLPVIIYMDQSSRPLVMPKRDVPAEGTAPSGDEGRGVVKKRSKATGGKASDPNLVQLKTICRDINIDAREARIKLRSLRKAKKLPHEPQGRWEWPKDQVDDIKAALQGGEKEEKKVKAPPKTKAQEKLEAKAAAEAKAASKSKPSKKAAERTAKAKRGARKGVKQHAKR